MERLLDDIFPILEVDRDCIVSKQGDVTVGFSVDLPEIFTCNAGEYESIHQTWVKAIKLLPRFTVFHKQDWFIEQRFQADLQKEGHTFHSRASERYFNERPFLDHRCYVYLTKKVVGKKLASSATSNLLRRSLVPSETLSPMAVQDFLDVVGQFQGVLESSKLLTLTRLSTDDFISTDKGIGLLEQYCSLQHPGESRVIRDLELSNGIQIGDLKCQLFTLSDPSVFPSYTGPRINYEPYSGDRSKFSIGFAAPLGLLLPFDHIYNQYIFIEDAPAAVKRLEAKQRRLQSLSGYSRQNAVAYEAVGQFLTEAASEQRLPVKAAFDILLWTADKDKLNDSKNAVSAGLAQMDAIPKQEVVGAGQIYWAGIPGNEGAFPANESLDTFLEQAVCFFNEETNYKSSLSPFGIRLGDRLTGMPVHVDLSDEPMRRGWIANRNKVIIGGSGSGKSFFTNHMVRSYYEQGTHVVLVDVGHSYQGLCTLVGGYYFTYETDNPIRFNPFQLGQGEVMDTEKVESIKTLLLSLWKRENEVFRQSEYVALSSSIQQYYGYLGKHPEVFAGFDSYYDFVRDRFTEVLKNDRVKDRDFDVHNFLYVLRPFYTGGEFDFLLNARENLDLLNQRFIVFELDNIKDHPILLGVCTIIVAQLFLNKMRRLKGVRKMILIEEAWKAIARDGMADYLKYLFKTVRKFFGEAVVVTQEIDDIIHSAIVKEAIINNADTKILLDQSRFANRFDNIQAVLGLTDKEKALVLSVNKANDPLRKYKEVFISLGGQVSKVYRTEVSLEEYYTYSTEESEKVKVRESAERNGGDMERGIAALSDEMRNK
jgi:conjugation system TraG family ATPase